MLLVVFVKVNIFTASCKERLVEKVRVVEKERLVEKVRLVEKERLVEKVRVVEFLLSPMGGDLQVFSE